MPERMVIGICTYNRGQKITRTLEAIAGLDPVQAPGGPRLARVVIVDNRSTDDTAAVADAFIAERGHALPFEISRLHEPRPGKVAALRTLFAATSEPIVGVIDDDTLPDPSWARGMLSLLDDQPRAGAVGGPVPNLWESGPTRLARIYHRSLGDQDHGPARKRLDHPRTFLMGASTAYRRRAVEDSGWLKSSILECRRGDKLECGEDAELCLRIRSAGWEIWYEPSAPMQHIIPPTRQTATYLARLRESICRSEPWIWWMADQRGRSDHDIAWAVSGLRKAQRRYLKSLLTDLRPTRRRIRIAERRGRRDGWIQLLDHLRQPEPATRSTV
jgi:cellulose synthase/poly-beta-1,6-N-acetylglucosamine synthase-like glycosyltransferase